MRPPHPINHHERRARFKEQYRAQRGANPIPAEEVLKKALARLGLDREIARYRFVLHWKEIVGEEIAKRSKPECIKNRALVVRVADSAWAQELSFQKHVILTRLRRYLDQKEIVEDVIFYVVGPRGRTPANR